MPDYRSKIEEAVQATVFGSSLCILWFGERLYSLPRTILRIWGDQEVQNYLLDSLQSTLYNYFYCHGLAIPRSQQLAMPLMAGDHEFLRTLSNNNTGVGTWEDGWFVHSADSNGQLLAQKQIVVAIRHEDVLPVPAGEFDPRMGLHVKCPKESLYGAPGYYVAFGNATFIEDLKSEIVRFYFNLRARGAARVMQLLTNTLNRVAAPFQFKVLSEPAQYTRCDAGVLYIRKQDYEVVSDAIEGIYNQIADCLKPGTPVFTKVLAPGLGLAEDPGTDESFGLNRCRVLADGMVRANVQEASSLRGRADIVARVFHDAGISLDTPYLNVHSLDQYEFHVPKIQYLQRARIRLSRHAVQATFQAIAQQLCDEAIWDQTRCNWLGSELLETNGFGSEFRAAVRALGPDLYAGSSGVGLFLAEAYRASGDSIFKQTARGAIRHALSIVSSIPTPQRIGLFTGLIGIAVAGTRVGLICEDAILVRQSRELVTELIQETNYIREFDLLSGKAGAIVGLLTLYHMLNWQPFVHFAVELADELLQDAESSASGYSWRTMGSVAGQNLTGLSHGTAGVGYALLELSYALGGVPRYQRMAEEAFNYERYWFDADTKNWPHFNAAESLGNRFDAPSTFVAHWCHGAPGIALSRLRAYRLFDNHQYRAEAIAGLETTMSALRTWLNSDTGNFSLCHGYAGNAEVLGYAATILGDGWKDGKDLRLEVASHGITSWSPIGYRWPCGIGSGEHPGFMVGLAGIGYYYLRLFDPSIPSILLLEPESFADGVR